MHYPYFDRAHQGSAPVSVFRHCFRNTRQAIPVAFSALRRLNLLAGIVLTMVVGRAFAGQFVLTATNVAPANIFNGQQKPVLKIVVTNPVAGGLPSIRWSGVGLQLQDSVGTALTPTAAASLLTALEVYKDSNNSGIFEPEVDVPVISIPYLPLAADGSFILSFDLADPADLTVASGVSSGYFILARVAENASASTPSAFKITHLVDGINASTAVNAANGASIAMDPTANVSSSVVQAVFNAAPTTSGIANVSVLEPAQPTSIPLYPSFADAEDPDSSLTFAVTANSNPALSSVVGIDQATGVLTITHNPAAVGNSQITIQATDTAGKSVATTFTLNLSPLSTYAQFANYAFGGTGTGTEPLADFGGVGVKNQIRYAFSLVKPGDRTGLPRITRTGNARVLSYRRPKYATDLTYSHEMSGNLATWTNAVENTDIYRSVTDLGDGSLRVDLLLLSGGARTFVRVKADLSGGASLLSLPPVSSDNPSEAVATAPPVSLSAVSSVAPPNYFPTETIVADPAHPPYQSSPNLIAAADLDGDSYKDIVVVSSSSSSGNGRLSWYRNLGSSNTFGSENLIATLTVFVEVVLPIDINGDGKIDVVTVSHNSIAPQPADGRFQWYRNLGNGSFAAPALLVPISSVTDGACAIAFGDLNGDGIADMVCGARSGVAPFRTAPNLMWYAGTGNGNFNTAAPNVISGAPTSAVSVAIRDFDRDGKPDILLGSRAFGAVYLYRQNPIGTFTRSVVFSDTNNVTIGEVAVADFDGDNWPDVVTAVRDLSTNQQYYRVAILSRNNHDGTFTSIDITSDTLSYGFGVTAGDFDKDGDMDVSLALSPKGVGTSGTPGRDTSRVAWFRNLGGGDFGELTSNRIIVKESVPYTDAWSVVSADFNNDGAADLGAAWNYSGRIAVYYNSNPVVSSSQVAFSSSNTAPVSIFEGAKDDVLSVTVSNLMAVGASNAKLSTLALLFEKQAGVAMTTAEVNNVIETLHVYMDSNNSGSFEPASDKVVSSVFFLPLTSGRFTIPMSYADPASILIPPQASRKFFVVPELKASAAGQVPNVFRISHLGQGVSQSTAKDATSGALLIVDPTNGDTPSSFVSAVANLAPVSGVIPSVTVFDTSPGKEVLLTNYFTDAEDGAGGLQYSLTGNSNPGVLKTVSVDTISRKLSITFLPGVAGSTVLTLRARDSLGKTATASVQVNVFLAKTYAAWSQIFYGTSAAGNLNTANLRSYAFGIAPVSGDAGGLPRLFRSGSVWVLRHRKQKWTTDLAYGYEFSSDLGNWSAGVSGTHFYEFTTALADGLVQSDVVLLGNWSRLFVRPRANLTP